MVCQIHLSVKGGKEIDNGVYLSFFLGTKKIRKLKVASD